MVRAVTVSLAPQKRIGYYLPGIIVNAVLAREETPPRLGEIVCLIVSLGGYLGRKRDGSPGPNTMWIGL
jgi:hypothetical protein